MGQGPMHLQYWPSAGLGAGGLPVATASASGRGAETGVSWPWQSPHALVTALAWVTELWCSVSTAGLGARGERRPVPGVGMPAPLPSSFGTESHLGV